MLSSPLLTLFIFLLFMITDAALAGWGDVLGRLCKVPFSVSGGKCEKILLGIFCLYLCFGVWNFFFPVNQWFSCCFLLVGIAFFFAGHKVSKQDFNFPALILSFLFISFSFSPITAFDYYLYHADTIRWITEYSVVPGLANVHSRFGFNQFFFYIPAMFETLLPGKGWSVANPFLAWTVFCHFWDVQKKKETSVLALLICGGILYYGFSGILSSPTPDCFSNFLQLIILSSFVWQLEERKDGRFVFFMLLSVVAVLTKTFTSFLCIIVLLCVFILEKDKKKVLLNSLPLSFVLGLVWCIRSVFLSGYMLYPVSWPSFEVDWKLPAEILEKEQAGIIGWARWPGKNFIMAAHQPVSYWIENWYSREGIPILQRYLNGCVIGWILLVFFRGRKFIAKQWLIAVTIISCMIFWFFTAPVARFADGILYFMLIYPFSLLISPLTMSFRQRIILLCVLSWIFTPFAWLETWAKNLNQEFSPRVWRHYSTIYTRSQLNVSFIPGISVASEKPPLPTTPYFKPDLSLRGADIQSGFVIHPAESEQKIMIYRDLGENMSRIFQRRENFAEKTGFHFPDAKLIQVNGLNVRIRQKKFTLALEVAEKLRGKKLLLSLIVNPDRNDGAVFTEFSVSGNSCPFEENLHHNQIEAIIDIPAAYTNQEKIELLCTIGGE